MQVPEQALRDIGVWDEEFVTILAGRGGKRRPMPHPFISARLLPPRVRDAWDAGRAAPLVRYLSSPVALNRPLSPLFDARSLPEALRAQHRQPGGALRVFLESASPSTPMPVPQSYHGPAPPVATARRQLLEAAVCRADCPSGAVSTLASQVARVPGRVSVVLLVDATTRNAIRAVRNALSDATNLDHEIVLVDCGATVDLALDLAGAFMTDERVSNVRLPATTRPGPAFNLGFAHSSGEFVAFLSPSVSPSPGWLRPLVTALADVRVLGAQPLVHDTASAIACAGLVFPGEGDPLPHGLIRGHPSTDGVLAQHADIAALGGSALAVRSTHFEEVGGFDDLFKGDLLSADLCLRIRSVSEGRYIVCTPSTVASAAADTPPSAHHLRIFQKRWREKLHASEDPRAAHRAPRSSPSSTLTRTGPLVPPRSLRPTAGLRWGIKIASTPGRYGDVWGDTFLAESLAHALMERGHHATVYRRGLHEAPGSDLDDVALGIRGLVPVSPRRGKVNLLWIISHPEDVTAEEVEGFDIVYAASPTWAAGATRALHREIRPLLQATDTNFAPSLDTPLGSGNPALFVGSARGRDRRIVRDAMEAGVPVAVVGPGWRGKVPRSAHLGRNVDNRQLQTTYRRFGLVLADHWPDMAAHGFVANRLFDAVAAGALVISDHVAGVDDLFAGAVQTYDSAAELRDLVNDSRRQRFPDPETMSSIVERVRTDHSFEARASTLQQDVYDLLAQRSGR